MAVYLGSRFIGERSEVYYARRTLISRKELAQASFLHFYRNDTRFEQKKEAPL